MSFENKEEGSTVREATLVPIGTFGCDARCCCVFGNVVWVAELKGGIAVCDAQSGKILDRISFNNKNVRVHIKSIIVVLEEIWAGSIDGVIYIFDAPTHRCKRSLTILGIEASAPITCLFFDGRSVFGGSETGRIVQWNPYNKRQISVLIALAPVTSLIVAAGLVISGDREGAVQLWDSATGEIIHEHRQDKSAVTSLLCEVTTGTLWVGRRNGSISIYGMITPLKFEGRLSVGERDITSLISVSGKVLVTTYDKVIVVFSAANRLELSRVSAAHDSFIYGAIKVFAAERVRAWTIGNDGSFKIWDISGYFIPCESPSLLRPCEQAAIINNVKGALTLENAELSSRVALSQNSVINIKEELRRARDETHELRLRNSASEHLLKEKDFEIATQAARVTSLEEEIKKLQKDATDANARADAAQRESTMLRTDHNNALQDASQARAQLSAKIAEKAEVEQQVLAQRNEKSHLEIRLRDREAEVSQLKAENARLQGTLGQLSSSQLAEKGIYQKMFANTENAVRRELDEFKKKSQLMSALLVSMEYTIRRKEEEERDLTALLNAFRRKAAEHVTDPHLAALLNLTMMRNPSRFEMECDEHTKSLLRDRNGPFIRFLQQLRDHDPRTYQRLVEYLQHPAAGSEFSSLFDRMLNLAQNEGEVHEDDIVTFKKSLPVLLDSLNATIATDAQLGGIGNSSTIRQTVDDKQGLTASSIPSTFSTLENNRNNIGTTTMGSNTIDNTNNILQDQLQKQQQQLGIGINPSGNSLLSKDDDLIMFMRSLNIGGNLPDSTSQIALGIEEDGYVKQLRSTFEFILKTRRDLVEQLALLSKRVVKARQVVDALTSNAKESSSSQYRRLSIGVAGRQNLASIASNILEELHRLVSGIIITYFTAAEKQRLGLST